MHVPRRRFLQFAGGAVAAPAFARRAAALDYPTRPVRILVGYAAGGAIDIIARLLGERLSQRLGQPFVIDNRPGAGSNLATEDLIHASPDGYTLLDANAGNTWNATLYDNLRFDFIRDTAPVATIVRTGGVMEVNPSVPAKTVAEFIAYAKANPGKINMASAGPGSGPFMYGELFKMMAGVDLTRVDYRGSGPALPDLISGRLQVMFDLVISSIDQIRAGKLRPLGVTTAKRMDVLPDVPPIADFVPGYEAIGWQGLVAPAHTPAEIIDRLNNEVNAALADPTFKMRLADLGAIAFASSPAEFSKLIEADTEKWAKLVRFANLKAE
jgi:tripartite-type tricarboxylate transporter receptor subunit TctC